MKEIREQGPTVIAARPLGDKSLAVGLFNRGEAEATVVVRWSALGFQGSPMVRDLWAHNDLGSVEDRFSARVPAHGVVLIKVMP